MVLAVAVVAAVVAVLAGMQISRFTGWGPAGPIAVIALTPLLPRVDIALGISLDDVLPLVGLAMLLRVVPFRTLSGGTPRIGRLALWGCAVGVGLLVIGGIASSLANGGDLAETLRMLARSSGRFLFLLLIALALGLAIRARPSGSLIAARGLAVMGLAEAAFGLFAFLVPLPDRIGLAGTRPWSVLWGEVPGRISGTLGLSPNFTGAVLMLSVLVTVGLAARPVERTERYAWLAAALLQLTALTLTFSRAPLALALIGLVAVAFLVSRPILLAPLAVAAGLLGLLTPIAGRFLSDVTDRLALWYSAWLIMLDHPLTGVGPGRMDEFMRTMPDRYMDTPFGRAVSNAHNTILLPAAELGALAGIGGALLNLSLLTMAVVVLLRVGRDRAAAHVVGGAVGALAFLVQGMVNNLFTVGVTSVMGAFVFGAFVLPMAFRPQGSKST